MSIENKNYQLTERGEKFKKIVVRYIGVPALAVTVGVGLGAGAREIAKSPGIVATGHLEEQAGYGTNLTEMVKEDVHYDANEVPTQEIVNYVEHLPANVEPLKDGLDAEDVIELPTNVERPK
jgi:hypothetical protein